MLSRPPVSMEAQIWRGCRAKFEADGRTAAVRLKMPRTGVCRIDDLVRGTVESEWSAEADHVIQRADGGPVGE